VRDRSIQDVIDTWHLRRPLSVWAGFTTILHGEFRGWPVSSYHHGKSTISWLTNRSISYTPDTLSRLIDEFSEVDEKYHTLLSKLLTFARTHPDSHEYTLHGFLRRLGTLQRCIQNVYFLYPPTRSDIPSRETCVDLTINLQSFVFNVFGCLDNLAWIWVIEHHLQNTKGSSLRDNQVGFLKKIIKSSFTVDFQNYLDNLHQWFTHLVD